MNKINKLLLTFILLIYGCKTNEINTNKYSQRFSSLDMNIYSKKGSKLYSINSAYSSYDKVSQIFNLNETTIYLFDDNKSQYIITSDNSIISNNNKKLELIGNVKMKTLPDKENKLYGNTFTWIVDESEYTLKGDVKFENNNVILSSNKAKINKGTNIIEFYNPVKYIIKSNNEIKNSEIVSENAYYNIDTKSLKFTASKDRVRSKVYF